MKRKLTIQDLFRLAKKKWPTKPINVSHELWQFSVGKEVNDFKLYVDMGDEPYLRFIGPTPQKVAEKAGLLPIAQIS